jgi:hypothetical protein
VHTYIEKTRRRICDAVKIKHNSLHKNCFCSPENLCDPLKSMSEKWVIVIDRTTPTFITLTIVGWVDLLSFFNDSLNDSLNHCEKVEC